MVTAADNATEIAVLKSAVARLEGDVATLKTNMDSIRNRLTGALVALVLNLVGVIVTVAVLLHNATT